MTTFLNKSFLFFTIESKYHIPITIKIIYCQNVIYIYFNFYSDNMFVLNNSDFNVFILATLLLSFCQPQSQNSHHSDETQTKYDFKKFHINNTSNMHNAKIVLLACGSFNPPTYMHLRMFGN